MHIVNTKYDHVQQDQAYEKQKRYLYLEQRLGMEDQLFELFLIVQDNQSCMLLDHLNMLELEDQDEIFSNEPGLL